jgi:hypothetical protein
VAELEHDDAMLAGLAALGEVEAVRGEDLARAAGTLRAFKSARRQRTRARVAWAGGVAALAAAAVIAVITVPRGPSIEVDSGSFVLAQDRLDSGASVPTGEWMRVDDAGACLRVAERRACVGPGSRLRIAADGGIELERGRVRVDAGVAVRTPMGDLGSDAPVDFEVTPETGIVIVHEGMATLATSGWSTALEPGTHALGETPEIVAATPAVTRRVPIPSAPPEDEPMITGGDDAPPNEAVAVRKPTPRASEPKAVPSASEMLVAARALSSASKLESAARAYQKLIDTYPSSSEAKAALVSLGRVQASRGKHAAALAAFDAYLGRGGGALSEEAHWGKISALHALGRTADRDRAITTLAAKYPKSVYLGKARKLAGG